MRHFRQIVVVVAATAALCLASFNAMAQNLTDQEVFASKIDALMRNNEFDYAQAAMLKYLEIEPDAPPVKRKLAHYYMKTTGVAADGLMPVRYPDDRAEEIITLLDEVLAVTPDDTEALSLLIYTHAVQGNVEQGKAALAKASVLATKDDWQDYNAALLAIQDNRLNDAAALLQSVAVEKQLPAGPDANRIFDTSWDLLYEIALEDPRLDPLPAVRDGLATRVHMDDVPEYILDYDEKGPPVMLHISSQDRGCGPCIQAMDSFYDFARANREQGDKYHVVYASMEPWRDINDYTDVLTSISVRGVPAYLVVDDGEYLFSWSSSRPKALAAMLENPEKFLESSRLAIKVEPRETYVLDFMLSKYFSYKDSNESGFKAMAYAIDGRFWQYARQYGYATQEEADKAALEVCQAQVEQRGETVACKLYAQGDSIVDKAAIDRYNDREREKKKASRRMEARQKQQAADNRALARQANSASTADGKTVTQGVAESARGAIAEYTKIEEHFKAIALAQDSAGSVWGIASKALTQQRANIEALEKCKAAREEAQLSPECQLHSIGKTEVTDFSPDNISAVTAKQQKRNARNSDLAPSYIKFRKFSDDKAYAISIGDNGEWAYATAFGQRGEDKAIADAMAECEIARAEKNLPDACQILIINSDFIELEQ